MNVYIMTDLECVAGVVTLPEYCLPGPENKYRRREGGRCYDLARTLATEEVNAAVDGLLQAGATDILVCDGHGPGGLDATKIHPHARILTGAGQKHPRGLDDSFDAAIIIGQHAMADTDGGHLCHSGSFSRADWRVNGQSVGEIALFCMTAATCNVPVVMLSGDVAACDEARTLLPNIKTAAVIEGQKMGSTRGLDTQKAIDHNVAAIHLSPIAARQRIRETAATCLTDIDRDSRTLFEPPFEMTRITRPDADGMMQSGTVRAETWVDLLNAPIHYDTSFHVSEWLEGKR